MTLRELGGPIVTMLEAYGTEEWIAKETDRLALDNMFNRLTDLYNTAVNKISLLFSHLIFPV